MKANRNPLIRVSPLTRQRLKIIAAHTGETMQETVTRLSIAEMERIGKKELDRVQRAMAEQLWKEDREKREKGK